MFRILKKSLRAGVVTGQHPASRTDCGRADIRGKRQSQAVPFLAGVSRGGYRLV